VGIAILLVFVETGQCLHILVHLFMVNHPVKKLAKADDHCFIQY